jgi:fatty-acyl-CoA synthase
MMQDREVGEIQLRGTSISPGYFGQEQASADARQGDWFRTGDLGYVVEGELVVCGRLKDVIIVGGRNVFPEDVERAAESVEGVRAGNVIAFGTEGRRGREAVVVVAETKVDEATPVRNAVAARVTDAVGVPPEDVVLVEPGTLPKTSSGKPQRSLCRRRYLGDELAPL